MNKIVYNACYGGFGLSRAATQALANAGVEEAAEYIREHAEQGMPFFSFTPRTIPRHDPRLVKVVEDLGRTAASAECADLEVYEIEGRLYQIREEDGREWVIESTGEWVAI